MRPDEFILKAAFKQCTNCDRRWISRDRFLQDPKIQLIGYQVNYGQLELGFFLFNHLDCRSTISIRAGTFRDLYVGPVFSTPLVGTKDCLGYCSREDALEACPSQCEGAYVREILQIVSQWPKA